MDSKHSKYIVHVEVVEYNEHGQKVKTVGNGSCGVYDEAKPENLPNWVLSAGEVASQIAASDFKSRNR